VDIARLHVVTPDQADPTILASVIDAGARWLQIRTKSGSDAERLARTVAVVAACRSAGATALVNDRVDLAAAAYADGVHLGLDDLPVAAARRLLDTSLGPGAIVGATCRNPDQARLAAAAGASYLGVGPVYATTTKSGLPAPIGLAGLAAVVAAVDLPVIAISGIDLDRVPDVLATGAHGVAVVGAVFGAADPARATRHLLDAVDGGTP
jgi:thiamine-phosphate pyrophosphorylase